MRLQFAPAYTPRGALAVQPHLHICSLKGLFGLQLDSRTFVSTMPKRIKVKSGAVVVVGSIRHPHSAVGAPKAKNAKTGQVEEKGVGAFRFWTDARRFKGSEEKCIVQQALFEAGGVRIGGYPKASPVPGPLGFQRPSDWDLLWSPARLALKALPVKAGQLVSACPGLMSLTRKRKLSLTLKEALGEEAFTIMPRTFSLPDELDAWRRHVGAAAGSAVAPEGGAAADAAAGPAARREAATQDGGSATPSSSSSGSGDGDEQQQQQRLWILKTAQHLGKGLKLLPAAEAVLEGGKRRLKSAGQKPYVQAQEYVSDPLLIQGRKFGLRVWVLVTGHNPLRAYMHTNGLVLFSTHSYSNDSWSTAEGDVALGHVTNYAQNMDGMVWDMEQLKEHLGEADFRQLWSRISRNTALVCSAALPRIKAEHQALGVLPGSTFELLGLDYLVDSKLHPWLLEVNGTPSLAVDHEDPAVERLIHKQKMGMVRDMMSILNLRQRFVPRYTAMRLAASQVAASKNSDNNTAALSEEGAETSEDEATAMDVEPTTAEAAASGATTDEGERSAEEGRAVSAAANNAVGEHVGAPAKAAPTAQPKTAAAKTLLLRKRLREEMSPTLDSSVWSRVRQELQSRGGFTPLMPLFPVSSSAAAGNGSGSAKSGSIPWDMRDMELPRLMSKVARPVARTSGSGSVQSPMASSPARQ